MPGEGSIWLTNRATGQDEPVAPDQVAAALASGRYLDPGAVAAHSQGLDTYVAPEVARQDALVAPPIDPAQAALAAGHRVRENENTGALPTAEAVVGGGVRAASFGLFNPFEDAQEFNPLAASAGVVAGAVAPAFVGDVEGLVGAGRSLFGISREAAIADDALTAERAAGSLSVKALHTGEAAAGAVERDLARGAAEVKAGGAAAATERVAVPTIAAGPPLEELDVAGLKAAREGELEAIQAAQAPERKALIDELAASRKATVEEKPWIATANGKTRDVREIGKLTLDADKRIDTLLKNPVELAEKPDRVLSALRQQEHALTKLQTWGEGAVSDYLDERAAAPQTIREDLLAGKIKGYVPDALSQRGIDAAVEKIFTERYGSEFKMPTNLQALNSVPGAIARNKALQERAVNLLAEPTSDRLQQIDTMLAERAAPHEASLGERALHAVAPYLGPVGHVAEKAYAGIRKLVGAAGKKASGAASSFVDVAAKAAPRTPLIATRVLAAAAFAPVAAVTTAVAAATAPAPSAAPKKGAPAAASSTEDLHTLYQKRSQELRSLIEFDASGAPVMRQDARMRLGAQFDAVRAMSPLLADRMETVRARGIEYLASIMPKPPDFGVMQIGPDRRRVSDLEMRSWARSVAAVEDPHAVLERAAGGHVVPEEAAALRAVYPEILDDFTAQVIGKLPTLRKTLPYNRRLALSMLTGTPVDPAMTSTVLTEIQSMYASEPGTAGGTQAPRPEPQFGSVRRQDPGTPAQRREGLTA